MADNFADLAALVMRGDFEPLPASVPKPLAELVRRALSLSADERPSSSELATALGRWANADDARGALADTSLGATWRPGSETTAPSIPVFKTSPGRLRWGAVVGLLLVTALAAAAFAWWRSTASDEPAEAPAPMVADVPEAQPAAADSPGADAPSPPEPKRVEPPRPTVLPDVVAPTPARPPARLPSPRPVERPRDTLSVPPAETPPRKVDPLDHM